MNSSARSSVWPWMVLGLAACAAVCVLVAESWLLRAVAVCVLVGLLLAEHWRRRAVEVRAARSARQVEELNVRWRTHVDHLLATAQERVQELQARVGAVVEGREVPDPSAVDAGDALGVEGLLEEICGEVAGAFARFRRREESARRAAEEASARVREFEESAQLVVAAVAGRVLSGALRVQEAAARLGRQYDRDPQAVEVCMGAEHQATQLARLAQSLVVMCGQRTGQQWQSPLAMVDAARAAAGRIVAYQRVQVSGDLDVAAEPALAEGLTHLLAEVLANATQYSPPDTAVQVGVRLARDGVVVQVDDSGLGMEEHSLLKAREIASGRRLVTLFEVGEIPQLGLAVVGRFARRFGLTVDLEPSPHGGVRVITRIPGTWVTRVQPAGVLPATAVGSPPDPGFGPPRQSPTQTPPGQLPSRRSRRREPRPDPALPSSPQEPFSPEEIGARMAALFDFDGAKSAPTADSPADQDGASC